MWSQLRLWMRAVTGRARMETEMDAELRFHIEAFAEDLVHNGVPREEACRRARIEFVSLFLGSIALVATILPARRAMSVDPMVALRHE